MDVSKLPIQIVDPASTAFRNYEKDHICDSILWPNGYPNLHMLKSKKGIGLVLILVKNNPGIMFHDLSELTEWKLKWTSMGLQRTYIGGYINFARACKLINVIDKHKNKYRIYITELGEAVLKQNNLI